MSAVTVNVWGAADPKDKKSLEKLEKMKANLLSADEIRDVFYALDSGIGVHNFLLKEIAQNVFTPDDVVEAIIDNKVSNHGYKFSQNIFSHLVNKPNITEEQLLPILLDSNISVTVRQEVAGSNVFRKETILNILEENKLEIIKGIISSPHFTDEIFHELFTKNNFSLNLILLEQKRFPLRFLINYAFWQKTEENSFLFAGEMEGTQTYTQGRARNILITNRQKEFLQWLSKKYDLGDEPIPIAWAMKMLNWEVTRLGL